MSFFGFDTSLPRDRGHDANRPGFTAPQNPFAGLSGRQLDNDDDGIDFEDTYDGLGDTLDESADAFNADTFGMSSSTGKDFDFSGQTSKMADTMQDEHTLYHARQPPPKMSPKKPAAKPARSGYEKYSQPGYIPHLEAEASIWGITPKKANEQQQQQAEQDIQIADPLSLAAATKKMMSLEEVEAAMRSGKSTHAIGISQPSRQAQAREAPMPVPATLQQAQLAQPPGQMHAQHMDPRRGGYAPQRDTFQQPPLAPGIATLHQRGSSYTGRNLAHPENMLHMSDAERAVFLEEDAKRAKRNHKISMLSRDNGLMTPQDKNFITRIQLSQLMTATGNVDQGDPEIARMEDFYYDVFCQIRAPPRQDPDQPLNHYAQAYMSAAAGGRGSRRYPLGGQNQMRRMAQQVERAVEAARNRPKVSALNVEGSLGKISFSNAKTPKPLLNFKRPETSDGASPAPTKPKTPSAYSERYTLLNIEGAYDALMRMEDHERKMPPPPREGSPADEVEAHMQWRQGLDQLNALLWHKLKVHAPIDKSSSIPHPFVAIISHSKGKKLVPRIFRQLNEEQRLTILTIIVVHLDKIDVVESASVTQAQSLSREIREQVDLFQQAISPCFFGLINEASLNVVSGFIGLIVQQTNVYTVIMSRIGVSLLTMLISRAEIIKQSGHASEQDIQQWSELFDSVFAQLEPLLNQMFPDTSKGGDDVYVWQFLAAMGIGASPEQQQRLVLAVKDQVLDTISYAKTLPEEMSKPKLDNVNLFMTAIGLDVSMLS